MASETIEAQGHLIDSGLLSAIFDKIIEQKASYEVLTFNIGKTNDDASHIRMRITAPDKAVLAELIQQLTTRRRAADGCGRAGEAGGKDCCVPTILLHHQPPNGGADRRPVGGRGQAAMDAVIVVAGDKAECRKAARRQGRRAGDLRPRGIRVTPEFRERDRHGFAFMSNDVSSERRVEGSVARIAAMIREVKRPAGVAGGRPVVVHTGGVEHFASIIRPSAS
jgi:hypothetical protein